MPLAGPASVRLATVTKPSVPGKRAGAAPREGGGSWGNEGKRGWLGSDWSLTGKRGEGVVSQNGTREGVG